MIYNKTRGYFTILLLLLVCATTVANAQSEKERIERIAFNSAVFITATIGGRTLTGSGFFVAPNLIATNYHVIHQATEVKAFDAATKQEFRIEGATAIDAYRDLAILKTDFPPTPPGGVAAGGFLFATRKRFSGTPLSLGNSDKIRVNDTVYAAGYPGGERSFGKGHVKGLSGYEGCAENDFEVTLETGIAPGSSGGPVLNSSGHVIGISVRGLMRWWIFRYKVFAVRVNYLRGLISEQSGSVKHHFPINAQLYECSALSRGNMYFENGDYSKALEYFNSVISSVPGSAHAYLNRALLYYKLGNLAQARSDFNQAWNLTRSANFRALLQSVSHLF